MKTIDKFKKWREETKRKDEVLINGTGIYEFFEWLDELTGESSKGNEPVNEGAAQ